MKKFLCLFFICFYLSLSLQAQETQKWHIKSFLLPGIQSIADGEYVRGCFFLGIDAIAVMIATTPIETQYNLSHNTGDYIIIRDYTPLISGLALYGICGVAENIAVNGKNGTINLLEIQFVW